MKSAQAQPKTKGNSASSWVSFAARAEPGLDPLRSPVTGQACVHWRLRIVEHLTARSALVHEVASPESFELAWGSLDGGRPPVRISIDPDAARIEATPTLYREGSPGALAVGRAFGFEGAVTVEEVLILTGQEVDVEGVLSDPGPGNGPFRTAHRLELCEATVRLASKNLGPALLPWAFGTAAALLGLFAGVGWAVWRSHAADRSASAHSWTPPNPVPIRLVPPQLPRHRMP
jgi:hypothetical protein